MSKEHDKDRLKERAEAGDVVAQEQLGISLVSGTASSTPEFVEGLEWLRKADQAGSVTATLALGHVHAQNSSLPDAPAVAFDCYARAARSGNPDAVERLADLFQFAYGAERDDGKAFSMYQQLCAYGFPQTLCQTAYMLSEGMGCDQDETQASTLILRAAAQGHELAFYLLALRYAQGLGVVQNPGLAAAWMGLAAKQGFPGAEAYRAEMAKSLTPEQILEQQQAESDLDQVFKSLRKGHERLKQEVQVDDPSYHQAFQQLAQNNWEQLGRQELSFDPEHRSVSHEHFERAGLSTQVLGWQPRVFSIEGFASDAECAYLIDAARPVMKTREESEALGKAMEIDEFDGGRAIFFPHLCTPVIRNLQRRWASVLHINDRHFEPMSVLRYRKGHGYTPHVDYFDIPRILSHSETGDSGGQRLVTALVYLISPTAGGETCYQASGLRVKGRRGTAVIHYNATADGLEDEHSLHYGEIIESGEKWLARTAVREKSLYDEPFKII
jgi:TPR repeat protein